VTSLRPRQSSGPRFILFASRLLSCFFFNDTATTEIYTLSLHDALPIDRPNPCHHRLSQLVSFGMRGPPKIGLLPVGQAAERDNYRGWTRQAEPFRHGREDGVGLLSDDQIAIPLRGLVQTLDDDEAGIIELEDPLDDMLDRVFLDTRDVDHQVRQRHGLDHRTQVARRADRVAIGCVPKDQVGRERTRTQGRYFVLAEILASHLFSAAERIESERAALRQRAAVVEKGLSLTRMAPFRAGPCDRGFRQDVDDRTFSDVVAAKDCDVPKGVACVAQPRDAVPNEGVQ